MLEFAVEKGIDFVGYRNFIPRSREDCASSLLYFPREHNRFFDALGRAQARLGLPVALPPRMPTTRKERRTYPRATCSWPFEVFGILTDGKVHPCCASGFDLGTYESGIDNVLERWRSPNFVELRRRVNSDNPLSPCSRCEVVEYNPLTYRPEYPTRFDRLLERARLRSRTVKGALFGEALDVDWRAK
jgi:MoaA/NifB/PqqE/SkfB family radical SAM enzyme